MCVQGYYGIVGYVVGGFSHALLCLVLKPEKKKLCKLYVPPFAIFPVCVCIYGWVCECVCVCALAILYNFQYSFAVFPIKIVNKNVYKYAIICGRLDCWRRLPGFCELFDMAVCESGQLISCFTLQILVSYSILPFPL